MSYFYKIEDLDEYLTRIEQEKGSNKFTYYFNLITTYNTLALDLFFTGFLQKSSEIIEKSVKLHEFLENYAETSLKTSIKGDTYAVQALLFYKAKNYDKASKACRIAEIIWNKSEKLENCLYKQYKVFQELLNFMCLYKSRMFKSSKSSLGRAQSMIGQLLSENVHKISKFKLANLVGLVLIGIAGVILQTENNYFKVLKILNQKVVAFKSDKIKVRSLIYQLIEKINRIVADVNKSLIFNEPPDVISQEFESIFVKSALVIESNAKIPKIAFYNTKNLENKNSSDLSKTWTNLIKNNLRASSMPRSLKRKEKPLKTNSRWKTALKPASNKYLKYY